MSNIRIHAFLHVPFEGLGCIEKWIGNNGHSLSYTHFYEAFQLPKLDDFDWLIVMGGPMSIRDEKEFPWLASEKQLIREAIEKSKTIIGICLGSQMIANALGATVFPNKQKEIGWFDLQLTDEGKNQAILNGFDNEFPVFHWHGETFDLPTGSKHLFQSKICKNQAFLYNENVLGLQFHFEVTAQTLQEMVENGKTELVKNDSIQSAEEIMTATDYIESNNLKMYKLLDYLANK